MIAFQFFLLLLNKLRKYNFFKWIFRFYELGVVRYKRFVCYQLAYLCVCHSKAISPKLHCRESIIHVNLKHGFPATKYKTRPGSLTPAVGIATTTQSSVDAHALSTSQRTALQHAHANSVGWFITQESSFGNLILPVLPRFDKQQ
ncbi:uncharacterized protein LOC143258192 [Tachypleus tridentatus]|uniref:uncharacterized protein LOC143258192 n=1 Tax=Tachypleus tridentatus TaxID=6853 RepID=UPI003FCF6859